MRFQVIIFNSVNGSLNFIVDNEWKCEEGFSNIPKEKALTPAVFLFDKNDSVEILEC